MRNSPFMRVFVPLISLLGFGYAAYYVAIVANPPVVPNVQVNLPPTSPYADTISGSGLIEANSQNVEVGSHLSGIADTVYVTEGQEVKKGEPLFKLDDRSAKADLAQQQSNVLVASAQVDEAKALLADQEDQLKRIEGLKPGISVTVDRVERARFATQTARARLEVADSALQAAKAQLAAARVTLEKMTMRAPIEGRILKVNLRPGEYAVAGNKNPPPVIMGNDKPLYVRVSIDENDLWRLKTGSKAEGALRSNRAAHFPLRFVRVEPYVKPKTSLTGATSERVDTRVLDVLYSIDETDIPLFVGQQVDVFISVPKK